MAGQLALIDRPLTVGRDAFGDDVDVGVALHNGTTGRFEYSLGVFAGTDAGARADRIDPLLSLRVGYNHGDLDGYSESDLDGGPLRLGPPRRGGASAGVHLVLVRVVVGAWAAGAQEQEDEGSTQVVHGTSA